MFVIFFNGICKKFKCKRRGIIAPSPWFSMRIAVVSAVKIVDGAVFSLHKINIALTFNRCKSGCVMVS